MRAWLPYASMEEAERLAGPLPDGVEIDLFRGPARGWPDSIGEVEFYVLPYMLGTTALDRVGEMASLRVVQAQTAGYENIAPLIPEGVTLCNAAGVHDTATAELAIALALASGRRIGEYARDQASGTWDPQWGRSIADQRILIVGHGRIGKAIEARLAGFETASITRVASRARPGVHGVDELDELLPDADVVFLIAPHTPQTDRLFDAARLARMPDGALLVNVSRGPLVDTAALAAETASGRLRAALDVVDPEPLPSEHPLWRTDGVLLTPHVGGAASSFPPRIGRLIGTQLRAFAAGEPLLNVVN